MNAELKTLGGGHDALALVAEMHALSGQMPVLIVPAELATFGPLLNLIVGGRDGVAVFRESVMMDEAVFIGRYREVFAALLADAPGQSALMGMVDRAIEHDRWENANLLAAFDLLDPEDGSAPDTLGATRYAAPAAAHAALKFLLLVPPTVPAAAQYLMLRARARGRVKGVGND